LRAAVDTELKDGATRYCGRGFKEARQIFERCGVYAFFTHEPAQRAGLLYNLASCYFALKQKDLAKAHAKQLCTLRTEERDRILLEKINGLPQ
jgi:hypothetical protein